MAQREKETVALDNGTEVVVNKGSWDKLDNVPVLLAGWDAGKASHHSITLGFALATKDKIEGAYLGEMEGIPVFDPKVIHEAMLNAAIDKYGLDVEKIRISGNRGAAAQDLNAIAALATANPAIMEQLKALNPELAAKLEKRATPK